MSVRADDDGLRAGDRPGPVERPAVQPAATDAQVIRTSIEEPALFWQLIQHHYVRLFAFVARRLGRDAADGLRMAREAGAGDVICTTLDMIANLLLDHEPPPLQEALSLKRGAVQLACREDSFGHAPTLSR